MFQFSSMLRWRAAACCALTAAAALSLSVRDGKAQDPAAAPPAAAPPTAAAPPAAAPAQPAPAASVDTSATWVRASDGGMPWQIAAMFTGFWVLAAVEIAVISKSANRLDKPKKKDEYQEEA
jgi:hypothetical protein